MAMKLRRCAGMAVAVVVAAGACSGSGSRVTLDKPPSTILGSPPTTGTTAKPVEPAPTTPPPTTPSTTAAPVASTTKPTTPSTAKPAKATTTSVRPTTLPTTKAAAPPGTIAAASSGGPVLKVSSGGGFGPLPGVKYLSYVVYETARAIVYNYSTTTGDRWADVTLAPADFAQVKGLINTLVPGGSTLSTQSTDGSTFGVSDA